MRLYHNNKGLSLKLNSSFLIFLFPFHYKTEAQVFSSQSLYESVKFTCKKNNATGRLTVNNKENINQKKKNSIKKLGGGGARL